MILSFLVVRCLNKLGKYAVVAHSLLLVYCHENTEPRAKLVLGIRSVWFYSITFVRNILHTLVRFEMSTEMQAVLNPKLLLSNV